MPIQVFGAGAVQTAYVSYLLIDLTAAPLGNQVLVWPTSYVDVPYTQNGINYNVLAASIDVITGANNQYKITLPDATQSTVGANFIITNVGASPFRLYKQSGGLLLTVPPPPPPSPPPLPNAFANSYWIQLTDNSTPDGKWKIVQFGAGTSSAQASVLAGTGLKTLGPVFPQTVDTLNTNIPVKQKTQADAYTIQASDGASLLLWKGGAGNITLPLATAVTSGFYVSFNNQGSGELTIIAAGGATIDRPLAFSLKVEIRQSLTLISDGANWWSLGFGQNDQLPTLFGDGNAALPSIAFALQPSTGIYRDTFLGFSVNGTQIANISIDGLNMAGGKTITIPDSSNIATTTLSTNLAYASLGWQNGANTGNIQLIGTNTSSKLSVISGVLGFNLDIAANATTAVISYHGVPAINIDNSGVVTLPAAPLPIGSGGTGATTAMAAMNTLIPGAILNGTLAMWTGMQWTLLPPGNAGQTLKMSTSGPLIPTWTT